MFAAASVEERRAASIAAVFVEADLLGYDTHGTVRVADNIEWLLQGKTLASGEPDVLVDRGAVLSWDARQLPGPYVVARAVELACDRAGEYGQATVLIRRAQHIACLGAYLNAAIERGLVIQIVCSTPSDGAVCAHGGCEPLFSPNPFAFGAPTEGTPILIDTSFSIVAEGRVVKAQRNAEPLGGAYLKDYAGEVTDDPAKYLHEPRGSIMPIGGLDHGYKGYALSLWSEVMTMGLANFGRLDPQPESEENSVMIQVYDPEVFGSLEGFVRQAEYLVQMCRDSKVKEGDPPVRVPGERALAMRARAFRDGLQVDPRTIAALQSLAESFGIDLPAAI